MEYTSDESKKLSYFLKNFKIGTEKIKYFDNAIIERVNVFSKENKMQFLFTNDEIIDMKHIISVESEIESKCGANIELVPKFASDMENEFIIDNYW